MRAARLSFVRFLCVLETVSTVSESSMAAKAEPCSRRKDSCQLVFADGLLFVVGTLDDLLDEAHAESDLPVVIVGGQLGSLDGGLVQEQRQRDAQTDKFCGHKPSLCRHRLGACQSVSSGGQAEEQ